MQWIRDHWQWIAIAIGILINIINAASAHFTQQGGGARKVLAFVVEMLSVVTSAGASVGEGPLSKLKLPLQSVPPPGAKLVMK